MNESEALEVTRLVSELWPNPAMTGVRQAFYARALVVIGSQAAAMDAVAALFVDERFQPAPGDIIDAALGVATGGQDAWELIVAYAAELQGGRRPTIELPEPVRRAMSASGARFGAVHAASGNNRQTEALRTAFLAAYRDTMRAAAAGGLGADDMRELTT